MSQLNFNDGDLLSVARGVINGNANDVDNRLEDVTVFRTTTDIMNATTDEGDGGNARGLSSGAYIFNNDLDVGALHFILMDDAGYTITSTNINSVTYTGTLPFIQSGASPQSLLVLLLIDIRLLTPNATAIDLDSISSLIIKLAIFVGCLKVASVLDSSFITIRGTAFVLCGDGMTAENVDTMQMDTMQMSDGTDTGGVGLRCIGSCDRLILSGADARPESTEAFVEIDATYTGTVSITGGTWGKVGTFFKGVRDGTDPSVRINNVSNVKSSSAEAFGSSLDNSLVTSISSANTPVKINAVWTDESRERFDFESSGRWTYTGLEDIDIRASFIGTIKDDQDGDRTVSVYLAKNGTVINSTQGGKVVLKAGSQIGSVGQIPMITGDYIEAFVENNDDSNNQVAVFCSMTINA